MLYLIACLAASSAPGQCRAGVNNALVFDDVDDHARVPTNAALDGFADFTIEAWFRTTDVVGVLPIAAKWRAVAIDRSWILNIHDGHPQFAIGVAVPLNLEPTDFVADGLWHNLAVVRAGTTVTMYLDGTAIDTGTWVGPVPVSTKDLLFGTTFLVLPNGFPPPGDGWLNGSLDEVRIWNIARTTTQLDCWRSVPLVGDELGLVGYWRFDEGIGQVAANAAFATGAALNATLGAAAIAGTDDPVWSGTDIAPLPYCTPCTSPPCGQVNSTCASLRVNGISPNAQGPFFVTPTPGTSITFDWHGPPGMPYILYATTNLNPGLPVDPPQFVVDINIGLGLYGPLYSGFDPYWGPLFITNPAGDGQQTFLHPSPVAIGITLYVQGLMFDFANTCCFDGPFVTTASFAISL